MLEKKIREEILGRVILDKDFREELLKNPEETLKKYGYPADKDFVDLVNTTAQKDVDFLVEAYKRHSPQHPHHPPPTC